MIVVPKELQIRNVDGFLNKIQTNQDDLLIPVMAKASFFGGLASAIQLANTWGRLSGNRKLIFQSSGDDVDSLLEKIIDSPYKFSAALMAKNIELRVGEKALDIKKALYQKAKASIEHQSNNQHGSQRGGICSFSFVDHSTKGFDKNFYTLSEYNKPSPRSEQQVSQVIQAMMNKSLRTTGGATFSDHSYSLLGRIFSELFNNTHEHGSREFHRDKWIKPAVRSIYTKSLHFNNDAGTNNMASGAKAIATYIKSLRKYDLEKGRYLEMGIVDSGLGFYKRWQSDHSEKHDEHSPTINEEYEIFEKCFTFRRTSSFESHKGMGLPEVMDKLSELKGFMKVRSGRLSLYRDFITSPYNLGEPSELYDWDKNTSGQEKLTIFPDTVGVAITILIPLGDKS